MESEDDVFDIYTQSKVKPWDTKNFTIVDSRDSAMQEIKDAVRSGKKVAIVSELTVEEKDSTWNLLRHSLKSKQV